MLNEGFAAEIDEHIEETLKTAVPVTLEGLQARPFAVRLIEKVLWLGSPYL